MLRLITDVLGASMAQLAARTARGTIACEVGELRLSAEDAERPDPASDPRSHYPYGGRGAQRRSRRIDGGR